MAEMCGSNVISTKSEGEFHGTVWSNELDDVPLIQRKQMLLSRKQQIVDKQSKTKSTPHIDDVKKENECSNSQGVVLLPFDCSVKEGTDQQLAQQQSHNSKVSCEIISEVANGNAAADFSVVGQRSQDGNSQGTQVNMYICSDEIKCDEGNNDVVGLEKVNVSVHTSPQNPMPSIPAKVKVEFSDGELLCSLGDGITGSAGADVPAIMVKNNILSDSTDDELDHIVLKERQQMLLRRKLSGLPKLVLEGNSIGMSQEIIGHRAKRLKEEIRSVDGELSMAGNQFNDVPARNASDLWRSSVDVPSNGFTAESSFTANWYLPEPGYSLGTEATKSRNDMEETDKIFSSKKTSVKFNSCNGQDYVPASMDSMHGQDYVPASMNSMQSSTLPTSVNVKVEPLDDNGLHNSDRNALANFSFKTLRVKSEPEVPDELNGDAVDHMLLLDRMKNLLTSGDDYKLNSSRNFECLRTVMPSVLEVSPIVPESSKPGRVNRPRKRKKTATDSVETALEEDAPGLLQVLIDQGISVDEIKLYGEPESNDALDESLNEDSFAELEAVMSKLFSQRTSLLKFAPLRCTKGSKPSYCLACLFSLVEQTRYLQFRNWPVEWCWCRDLQSFIFVFERHNRIVLERPEYGYATYFFELVDSLPIKWQVKRLVTAMKLASCGRITLIENKALSVGEDLTEGEARVLVEYGWIPNSGLGTMLNYCDRVVHDRKNEKDTSEWRSKIGRLLIDGYNGGSIVSSNIPKKVIDCRGAEITQIKLEL